MILGFKQKAVLEEFKKRKKMTIKEAARLFYGCNESSALNAFQTLELKGFIRFKRDGIWELIKHE